MGMVTGDMIVIGLMVVGEGVDAGRGKNGLLH